MLKELPEKWMILNCKEARKYLAEKYDCKEILNWSWKYIGFANVSSHNGCLGSSEYSGYGTTLILFADFKRLVLGETINNEMIIEIW